MGASMSTARRVFISYCHEDIDQETLEFLLHIFQSNAKKDYEVLIDRVNLKYGDDIPDFMSLLDQVDSVVILLTPAYKRKTLTHSGGVHTEYTRILARYDQAQTVRKGTTTATQPLHTFELIPVLFTGDDSSSIPDELRHLRYLSLVGLRVARDEHKQFMITKYAEQKFIPEVLKIVGNWRVSTTLKSADFKRQYNELYTRLFRELKANWSDTTRANLDMLEGLFVKTDAYKQIQKQDVYFIIGRKGSGKSTIADVLAIKLKDEYKGFIPLVANDFELEALYSLLGDQQIASDTTNVITRRRLFEYAWELLIYICAIEILTSLGARGKLTAEQSVHVAPLQTFMTSLRYRTAIAPSTGVPSHFWYAFSLAIDYVRRVIDESEPSQTQYYASIRSKLSREAFLAFSIGPEALEGFGKIIDTCKKRFLITLDGFDTKFDEFRANSILKYQEQLRARALFEIEWLAALLLTTLELKHDRRRNKFFELLEFCVTVPKDRYLEVRRSVRDGYRFAGKSCSLEWTGIELAILMRKRMEKLSGFETDPELEAEERLEEVHAKQFPTIPFDLHFEYHGHNYRITLFSYVLRHSFWRPRDILLHYAKILAVAENMRKRQLSVDMIRRVVKEVNFEVINTEFIQEFKSIVSNIEAIVQSFSRSKQTLSYSDAVAKVADINFDFAIGELGVEDADRKIEFLYDIGFLGVLVSEELREKLGITHKHAFYFNEGQAIKRIGGKDKFSDLVLIIHPIFAEYLRLDVSTGELTLNFDWDYLKQNEAMRHART
jgi:energy-coupling factor transporter ATP-binding protein EcfA2